MNCIYAVHSRSFTTHALYTRSVHFSKYMYTVTVSVALAIATVLQLPCCLQHVTVVIAGYEMLNM